MTPDRARRTPAAADEFGALAELIELLARKHGLRCVWELRTGALPFRTLAQRLEVAQPVLSQRLRELRLAGLVEVDEMGEYRLTGEGRRLQGVLEPFAGFAHRWAGLTPHQRVPRGAADRAYDEP